MTPEQTETTETTLDTTETTDTAGAGATATDTADTTDTTETTGTTGPGGDPAWLTGLDPTLQTAFVNKGWNRAESAEAALASIGTAYANLEKRVGFDPSKVIDKPADGTKPAEFIAANRELFGVPETPDGYEIERPEMPEGVAWNETLEKEALALFHEQGATPETVQTAMTLAARLVSGIASSTDEEIATTQAEATRTLQAEWGGQTKARIEEARTAMHTIAREAGIEGMALQTMMMSIASGAGEGATGDANVTRLFHAMAQHLREDSLAPLPHGASSGMTPAEAKAELDGMKQPAHPYAVAVKAGNRKALKSYEARREELFRIAAEKTT